MKIRPGPIIITFSALLTIGIWFFVRHNTSMFSNYALAFHSLGQIAGLTGFTLFTVNLALTTRLKFIENLFSGLDRLYKSHHLNGEVAFILLLFHPLMLLTQFLPSRANQLLPYLFSGSIWPATLGIIALISLTILIILTIYINMKYQNWKISHKLMGVVYLIAVFHIFLVPTDIMFYPFLKGYMIFVASFGGVSHIYGSYAGPKTRKKYVYSVRAIERKNNISMIELKPQKERVPFKAGQFAFLRFFDDAITKEQHPFTIASSPKKEYIRFAIKDSGDYTSELRKMKNGSTVKIEGPYGQFGAKDYNEEQIWIAGGIGVTPFLSLVEDIQYSKTKIKKIDLYYCLKNKDEAVFLKELTNASKKIKGLKITTWFSDEKGFIKIKDIESISGLKDKNFMICGPSPMMRSLSQQLIQRGTSKSKISFEDFDLK